MPKRKKRLDPDDPLKELEKLLSKLVPEQGMVARRNARTSVCAELRRVRTFIDKEYPSLTPKKQRRKRKTGQAKLNELLKQGWVVATEDDAIAVADAGVTSKTVSFKEERWVLIPKWTEEMLKHPHYSTAMLSKAARSTRYRKEMLMEERLRSGSTRGAKLQLVADA